jgi:cytochrome c peroxidase
MRLVILLLPIIIFLSCSEDESPREEIVLNIPSHFPEYSIPEDNKLTPARIKLGEKLFNSYILSRDTSLSCASCHQSHIAFANNQITTPGIENRPGTRNVPSLFNLIFYDRFLREGSVPTLEQQVLVPVQEHNEFDNNWQTIIERLNSDEEYLELLKEAEYIFPGDDKIMEKYQVYSVVRPIAAYQRTLLSVNSKYDKFAQGQIELNAVEELGRKLFYSDSLNCGKCHSGALFTDQKFYNNGLYNDYEDVGRNRFTNNQNDIGKFKVPSLRNVEITHPYMFDGSLESLDDVISHYESGGSSHPNKSPLINGFNLKNNQREALKKFLYTLSDY